MNIIITINILVQKWDVNYQSQIGILSDNGLKQEIYEEGNRDSVVPAPASMYIGKGIVYFA